MQVDEKEFELSLCVANGRFERTAIENWMLARVFRLEFLDERVDIVGRVRLDCGGIRQ